MRIDDFPKRTWPERPRSGDSPEATEAPVSDGTAPASVEAALTVLNAYVSGRPVPAIRVVGVEAEAQSIR
jgi:hypothetical protein